MFPYFIDYDSVSEKLRKEVVAFLILVINIEFVGDIVKI